MQVNLRQAHKLVEKIGARLGTLKITTSAAVSIWDEKDAEAHIRDAKVVYKKELERQLKMLDIRQEIRMSIQAMNATEINGLVSIRKGLLDQLATYRHVQGTVVASINTPGALAAKIAAAQVASGTGSCYGSDSVGFCVINDAEIESLDKKISTLQLRVEAVEDQLSTSNATAVIVLSDEAVRVLRTEGIVQ